MRVYDPANTAIPGSPSLYYINPIGIQSITLSVVELGSSTVLTSDTLQAFSANIKLQPQAEFAPPINFPMVQGIGFVTGFYRNPQPAIQGSVFNDVVAAGSLQPGIFKY